jgi:hypothetical protein
MEIFTTQQQQNSLKPGSKAQDTNSAINKTIRKKTIKNSRLKNEESVAACCSAPEADRCAVFKIRLGYAPLRTYTPQLSHPFFNPFPSKCRSFSLGMWTIAIFKCAC